VVKEGVSRVAWLADGKRVVVARGANFATWEELLRANPAAALKKDVIEEVRTKLLAHSKDWKAFEEATADLTEDERTRALFYLREKEDLREPLGENYQHLVDLQYSPPMCEVYEVEGKGEALAHGSVLFYGKQGRSMEMRPSPDGKYVLLTLTSYSDKPADQVDPEMFVVPTGGAAEGMPLALGSGCTYPDWIADGTGVLYLARGKGLGNRVGRLVSQRVLSGQAGSGRLLKAESLEKGSAMGAELLYDPHSRVRVVRAAGGKNDEVFVTATDVRGDGQHATIYHGSALAPAERWQDLLKEVPEGAVPNDSVQYFQPSPGGEYVAVPAEHGEVLVVKLATKEVVRVQPTAFTGKNDKLDAIPTWRNGEEVTFVRPVEGSGGTRRVVVVYSMRTGKGRVLSGSWPAAATDGWLSGLEPAPTPGLP
jgi:hypothetical protein